MTTPVDERANDEPLPSVVFSEELEDISNRHLRDDNLREKRRSDFRKAVTDLAEFTIDTELAKAKLCEALLLHDKLSLKVYGENLPLGLLVHWFGPKGVVDLLEQEGLEFVLWNVLVGRVDGSEGLKPLAHGHLTSAPHCDPEVSAELGLEWGPNKELPKRTKRRIIRSVRDNVRLIPGNFAEGAVNFAHRNYEKGCFSSLGLPYEKDLKEFNNQEKDLLLSLADDSLMLTIAAYYSYDFLNSGRPWEIWSNKVAQYSHSQIVHDATERIFSIENLLDLSKLVAKGALDAEEIPKLRRHPNTVKFRNWLRHHSNKEDAEELTRAYFDSLIPKHPRIKKLMDDPWMKRLSWLTFEGVAIATSGIVSGMIGMDSTLGMISGSAVGLATQHEFERRLQEAIEGGWNPRNFVDQLRSQESSISGIENED